MKSFVYKQSRESKAGQLSQLLESRRTVLLCVACEGRLGHGWQSKHGYWRIPNLQASAGVCDYCQTEAGCNVFVPESGGYHQQYVEGESIAAAAQSFQVSDNRRIR